MIRAIAYLALTTFLAAATTSLLLVGTTQSSDPSAKRQLVKVLGISDLSLSSEARYTRHPTQADVFAAFQDFPGAFEHFPTGSMIPPRPIGFASQVRIQPSTEKQD
ncbi:hypothetical protein SAMN05660420_00477 [Desulfuromusa kysingii]|uniref:Uncharacterized protein n=1 Tax=Desulfuromusa kysingii TaxID=37625 RepID=A0A1H3W510_9BACT|nr:hypothetical protein [Desulfuromusa kysingii]SDZ82146.1 hypothetical protein SAMN05660420_00477 [Desulfuromusa kysingii]